MSLLKPAVVEQSAAKVGVFGLQGSGKTTTSALTAIGLSKTYHKNAPVAFFDTETGSDFVIELFEKEGVPLLRVKSRAFIDMKNALGEAEEAGCCAYLVDSYTHPWQELVDAFKAKSRRKKLEFHQMDELKGTWRTWTDQMLGSSMHIIMAGRLGYVWDREEDDADGTKGDLIKLGSKMKSESEAGYEPSLLIEMEAIQSDAARQKKTRKKNGSIMHHAYVMKDRWRALNGKSFAFTDLNSYKAGDYKKVFESFRPHFDRLAIGGAQVAVSGKRSSAALFSDEPAEFGRRRTIALEEIQGSIAAVYPGQDALSKKLRQVLLEKMFGTLSWTRVESMRVERLEEAERVLALFRKQASTDMELVSNADGCEAVLQMCIENLANEVAEAETAREEAVI
jgi:hypothetical protein